MKQFLLNAKQLDDLQVDMFVRGGFDPQDARAIAQRSWPCTGDLLAVRLTMAGYAVTANDLVGYITNASTVVTMRGGHVLFNRADFAAISHKLQAEKRFTPAALDRIANGIPAVQDAARVEAEGERFTTEAQAHAELN